MRYGAIAAVLLLAGLLTACGEETAEPGERPVRATAVTVTTVERDTARVVERVVGRVESATSPLVAAEVAGRVQTVAADVGSRVQAGDTLARLDATDLEIAVAGARAEVKQLAALVGNQRRNVARLTSLQERDNVSEGQLEEAEAQLESLDEQLAGARSRLQNAERNLAKATITAPVDGQVFARDVAPGDYVSPGTPLFRIASSDRLRIHLPFPETMAARLRPGLPVTLTTPTAPEQPVVATLDSLRPMVTGSSRAVEGIVIFDNPGGWLPGASAIGELLLAEREEALFVPLTSLVRRPAGHVVYLVEAGRAVERPVTAGLQGSDRVEIVDGLAGGESVVVQGAGFLTDGAALSIEE